MVKFSTEQIRAAIYFDGHIKSSILDIIQEEDKCHDPLQKANKHFITRSKRAALEHEVLAQLRAALPECQKKYLPLITGWPTPPETQPYLLDHT